MSHTTAIKAIKIQSITALQAAVLELNEKGVRCTLVENAQPRAYYPNQQGLGRADYVLKLHDAPYDVGLYKQADGAFEARTDFWGKHVENVIGGQATKAEYAEQAKMGKLFQLYGIHAATEAARRQGHSVRRIEHADGRVQLEVTGATL